MLTSQENKTRQNKAVTTTKGNHFRIPTISSNHKGFKRQVEMLNFTIPILFPMVPITQIHKDIGFVLHLYENKGPEFTIRYLKATGEAVDALVLKLTHRNHRYEKVSLGLDWTGWPKWLGKRLKRGCLSSQDIHIKRYVQTIVSIRRMITIPTKTSLSSITQKGQVKDKGKFLNLIDQIGSHPCDGDASYISTPEIGQEVTDDRSGAIQTYTVPKPTLSMKKSPNGVSYFSFHWDRAAIVANSMEPKLLDYMAHYYKGDVHQWLDEYLEPYSDLHANTSRKLHIGKISLTHEAGKLKPRVFAIVDSVTQTLLGPLHDDLMNLLRSIPDDCTYDHDSIVNAASQLWAANHRFYGYADLSNATDSIPKESYESTLNSLKSGLGRTWVALFDRPFSLGPSVQTHWDTQVDMPEIVSYQTGQPMGALTSWPMMAYVHHRIVWTAFGGRKNAIGKYKLLGDDIVIFEKVAYKRYLTILRILGISYTNNVSTEGFEFAKRIFHRGQEITGAYTSALWASRNKPEIFALEWSNLLSRGYSAGSSFPKIFKRMLRISNKRYHICLLLTSVPKGNYTLFELATWVNKLQGRGNCFLNKEQVPRLVECVKPFRQLAALIIKQSFQKTLNTAKESYKANKVNFAEAFKKYSGLCKEQHNKVILSAITEYQESYGLRVRYLEKDLKLTYLNPTDKQLLRPNLPGLPRPINFEVQDKHLEKLRYRADHQLSIINTLRLDNFNSRKDE